MTISVSVCKAGGGAWDRQALCMQFGIVCKCQQRAQPSCMSWAAHQASTFLESGLRALKVADGVEDEQIRRAERRYGWILESGGDE